jgi:hypothetical protein
MRRGSVITEPKRSVVYSVHVVMRDRHRSKLGNWVLLLIGLAGCPEDEPTPPDTGPSPDAADGGLLDTGTSTDAGVADTGLGDTGVLLPCAPPLSVEPASASILPLDLLTIVASGGTGAYRFELADNRSGALINELTGAYLSGETGNTTDVVRVTDLGCVGEATVTITIVGEMIVRPTQVEAPPGTSFTFEVGGGSGAFAFALIDDGSGATLTPAGAYTAGAVEGRDIVRVSDTSTGRTIDATIDVVAGTTMRASPAVLFLAVDQSLALAMTGGSGYVQIQEAVTYVRLEDTSLVGVSRGGGAVTLVDRFTGQTAPATIDVVEPQAFTPLLSGDALGASSVLAIGDTDGDGFSDAIVSHPEADVRAFDGGGIYLYRGTAGGLSAAPVQVLGGVGREDRFGYDVVASDITGDGRVDLVVGIPYAESGGVDVGKVEVYAGLATGLFEETPTYTLSGRFGGDLFGWSVASCDFDADGRMDIAAGGFSLEDRTRATQAANQGGVIVFLQSANGFSDTGELALYGDVPDGSGGFTGDDEMHFGTDLAAADFDGDGACDLAVAAYQYEMPGSTADDGAVFLFEGSPSGLLDRPSLAWANQDANDAGGSFGRHLSIGDLDGDGMADLIVSHFAYDAGNSDQHGAIRVYRGRALPGTPITAFTAVKPADFEFEGTEGFDQVGWRSALGLVNGDAILDLVIGSPGDELMGGPGSAGTVRVFYGRQGQLPDVVPSLEIGGALANDRFGITADVLGDQNGDGVAELIVMAQSADDYGRDYGVPYVVSSAAGLAPLEMPSEAGGMRFGFGGDLIGDVNGDGFEDAVVSAPYAATNALGVRAGTVHLYLGSATGLSSVPAVDLNAFRELSSNDFAGWSVSRAGDFDGDGRDDFAVLARFEDLPLTFDTAVFAPEAACTVDRSNAGAVYVFRGTAGAMPAEPSFIYYGPFAGQGMQALSGGFDYDGDGFDDLIVGSVDWDRAGAANCGGVALVRGRPADPGNRIVAICASDFVFLGSAANDNLGRSVTPIGDVDGDGCDDLAAGAPSEDLGETNQGTVRVFYGWGGAGCPAQPEMTLFRSGLRNAQGGFSVAGREDLDGAGGPDLAVGIPFYVFDGNTVGAAAVLTAAYIGSRPREPAQDVTPPITSELFFDPTPGLPSSIAVGRKPGAELGRSVALSRLGSSVVLIAGAPLGDAAGVELSGGAFAFDHVPGTGLSSDPVAVFGGESVRGGGRVGEIVSSRGPTVFVGGFFGSSVGLDTGSGYVLDLR